MLALTALGLLWVYEFPAHGARTVENGTMGDVIIEQIGGFVGGGTGMGHLRMQGRVAWSSLSAADQAKVNALFQERRTVHSNLRYRLTREGPTGPETVEVPDGVVPQALIGSVKTTLE